MNKIDNSDGWLRTPQFSESKCLWIVVKQNNALNLPPQYANYKKETNNM